MKARLTFLAVPALLFSAAVPAPAQYQNGYNNQQFYNGVRSGGHGDYDHDRYHHYDNDQNYNNRNSNDRNYNDRNYHQGGIGPGKGALIGGAGGAALGAIFGGGLKGTLIGGAAGAGIGAIAGKAHQDNTRRNDGYYPR